MRYHFYVVFFKKIEQILPDGNVISLGYGKFVPIEDSNQGVDDNPDKEAKEGGWP